MERFRKFLVRIPDAYFFIALGAINTICLTLAYASYNGQLHAWEYPFSYIGSRFTHAEGAQNNLAALFYGVGMFLSGLTMLLIFFRDLIGKTYHQTIVKMPLYLGASLGFLLAAFSPNDTAEDFHVIGSTLFVAALWMLTTVEIYEAKKAIGDTKYQLLEFLFQLLIFAYAGAYLAHVMPLDAILQKPTIIIVIIALIYASLKRNRAATRTSGPFPGRNSA